MTNNYPAMTYLWKFMLRILIPDWLSGSPPEFIGWSSVVGCLPIKLASKYKYKIWNHVCICEIKAENINFIKCMAAILDWCKLGSLPYRGFNWTFICYLGAISETCGGINYVAICGGYTYAMDYELCEPWQPIWIVWSHLLFKFMCQYLIEQ